MGRVVRSVDGVRLNHPKPQSYQLAIMPHQVDEWGQAREPAFRF